MFLTGRARGIRQVPVKTTSFFVSVQYNCKAQLSLFHNTVDIDVVHVFLIMSTFKQGISMGSSSVILRQRMES